MKILFIVLLSLSFSSCTWFQVAAITADIIENYPSENIIEEYLEVVAEDYFNMEEGSLDISILTPEEK